MRQLYHPLNIETLCITSATDKVIILVEYLSNHKYFRHLDIESIHDNN